ncbi:MAG: twin-arginine translocase TatA/TatE family subunit [Opitutales bacterium]|nr:twin-arginine translocase TatA/TatE family subunit [Opitutales bacterium]
MNFHPNLAFIQGIGGPELLIILVIILLLFGAKRLPELAKGLGKSMKEFKKATQEVQEDFKEAMDSADPSKPYPKQQDESAPKASEGLKRDPEDPTTEEAKKPQETSGSK